MHDYVVHDTAIDLVPETIACLHAHGFDAVVQIGRVLAAHGVL